MPHGPGRGTTCQLYMRKFHDRDVITVEPFRAAPFPVLRDLTVDRNAFDRIIQAGGFITERCGAAPDANALPIPKTDCRPFDGRRCLHRLRCMRRGLPEQLRDALRQREDWSSGFAPKAKPKRTAEFLRWFALWTRKALAIARTIMHVKLFVRPEFRRRLSRG